MAQRSYLRHPHVLAFYGADVSRRMLTCTRTYAGVYADVCRGVQVAQLSCLRHPNVLAFYGAVTKGEQCSLLVELMDRDLRAFLHDNMRPRPHCTQVSCCCVAVVKEECGSKAAQREHEICAACCTTSGCVCVCGRMPTCADVP